MFLEAAHGRLQSHPNLRRTNTSKSTNIIVMDSAYMCGARCVSVEGRLCIYVSIRLPPRRSLNHCVKVEDIRDGKNKVFIVMWLGETPVCLSTDVSGIRDVALLECRSDGGARAGTNNNND